MTGRASIERDEANEAELAKMRVHLKADGGGLPALRAAISSAVRI